MIQPSSNNGLRINEGTSIIASVAVVLFVFLGAAYSMKMDAVETLPYVMRPTAWLAFALFTMAFTASSIRILYDVPYSRWAMQNRRYLGLSFALVHFVHAGIVLSNLAFTEASRTVGELSGGTLAYLFLFLMTITSNNASVRKMGAKNWKRLHKIGSYYIWLIFIGRSLPVALAEGITHAAIPIICFAALFLRMSARQKLKRRKA